MITLQMNLMGKLTGSLKKRLIKIATDAGDWDLIHKIADISESESESESESDSGIRDAMKRYLLKDLEVLTVNDIVDSESKSRPKDPTKVWKADLRYHIFKTTGDDPVIKYFKANPLCRMEQIDLFGASNVMHFFTEVFTEKVRDFYSLHTIYIDVGDKTSEALEYLFDYFSKYSKFVRQEYRMSGRLGTDAVVFVTVELNNRPNDNSLYDWMRGKINRNKHKCYYRECPSGSSANVPLILAVL